MADFGKLDFAVAFSPTTAFPLDARSYFDSYEAAVEAASQAVPVGSSDGRYYVGQDIVVVEGGKAAKYIIQPDKSLSPVGTSFEIGSGLKLDEDGTLSVDTATAVEGDNTKPVTSAAVFEVVGNIEAILETI